MAIITWGPSLSVGVSEMDEQHKKLIKIINELHDAMKAGKGKEVVAQVLSELINYTKTHFAAEEGYMTKFNYSDLAAQKLAHSAFVKKLVEAQSAHKEGKNVTLELMNFLNSWLTNHIVAVDKKYKEVFNQNGMK